MNRCLEREWLDDLPAADPFANGSRRDLRRLNWWMGNRRFLVRSLQATKKNQSTSSVIELGTGDGNLLLNVALSLGSPWHGTQALLLDQQEVVTKETLTAFHDLGWDARTVVCDALSWNGPDDTTISRVVLTNLFLHHFEETQLKELLYRISGYASVFIALEPRRSLLALTFSRLVRLIGANAVTRHDAPASVRAGFRDSEISRLWPKTAHWEVKECPVGAFGHLFKARKVRT